MRYTNPRLYFTFFTDKRTNIVTKTGDQQQHLAVCHQDNVWDG